MTLALAAAVTEGNGLASASDRSLTHAPKHTGGAPRAFAAGVLASQIVNNALHLIQPLLIAQLSGSLGKAAFFSAFDTAVHMAGSLAGGWPADRLGARRLLIVSTFLRGLSLALIPVLWVSGRLTLMTAMAAYTLDALVRGFVDTAAHTVPLELAEHDCEALDALNSRYEFAFDLGAVAGPLMLGALMLSKKSLAAHVAVPLGFMAAAAIFVFLPKPERRAARQGGGTRGGGTWNGLRSAWSDPRLLLACGGLAMLNFYPLRKLMSAFFAKSILGNPAASAWIGAAFGLGGAIGSLLYARRPGRRWIAAGALGTLALAAGWTPSALLPMLAAAFAFSVANVGARLAVTRRLQEVTPLSAAGGVTAVARFSSSLVSVVLKSAVGAAFALGGSPRQAFAVIGVGLVLAAAAQVGLAARLAENR